MIGGSEDTLCIGWVASVESERVTIELDSSTPGLVKAGTTGVVPVGEVNSYVTFPAGAQRLVAVITAIRMSPSRVQGDGEYVAQHEIERYLEATIVGRLENREFRPGISTYPSLFAPVNVASVRDVEAMFAPRGEHVIRLGEAVVAPGQDVYVDADLLLARHAAVLGSTGSGKSCTVTALIEGLLELEVPGANVVILDTNGEYAKAFSGEPDSDGRVKACVLGGSAPARHAPFLLPGWFMDNAEHLAMLQASEGVQAPLLQRAVADARLGAGESTHLLRLRAVSAALDDFVRIGGRRIQEAHARHLQAIEAAIQGRVAEFGDEVEPEGAFWTAMAADVSGWSARLSLATGDAAWDAPLTPQQRMDLETILRTLRARIQGEIDRLGLGSRALAGNFDAPRHYAMQDLASAFLPARIDMETLNEPRIRNYAATLLMRLERLLADSRYDFMTRVPSFPNALAGFLRLLLGRQPLAGRAEGSEPPWADEYRVRQSAIGGYHLVTIVDLSEVASDVLEVVTALLGRLVLEFAQRVNPRGSMPIWLVLEEAHRYVPASPSGTASRSTVAFERIAKEGRKFGVGLLLASQRPSELSRTLLSQCGTLIAHRVVNADDQELIRHATPAAGRDVLRQLPGLATQHAIILGEAVSAPTYVRVRDVLHRPDSGDPAFIGQWKRQPTVEDDKVIDELAAAWEMGEAGLPSAAQTEIRAQDLES